MHFRRQAALAALTAAAVTGSLASAAAAQAQTPAPVPTVTIHVNNGGIRLSGGNTITAGRTLFNVVTGKGDHLVNIARFHDGYGLRQFSQDIGKAFSGDTKAINRVDTHTVFRGGAEASPGKPGAFSVSLPRGRFLFLDQNTFKYTWVTVVGKARPRQTLPNRSTISLYTYGFGATPSRIPHAGWTLITNKADQPHFLEMNRVKMSTTAAQVRRYLSSGGQGRPSFALAASTGSGVLTQGQHQALRYNLPAGKYLLACYWPDRMTGMPHAFMGMWKLVILS
jgi:hypothetical protein